MRENIVSLSTHYWEKFTFQSRLSIILALAFLRHFIVANCIALLFLFSFVPATGIVNHMAGVEGERRRHIMYSVFLKTRAKSLLQKLRIAQKTGSCHSGLYQMAIKKSITFQYIWVINYFLVLKLLIIDFKGTVSIRHFKPIIRNYEIHPYTASSTLTKPGNSMTEP